MNEEFERRWERKVEFLLNQQAKFDAKMTRLEEAQEKTEKAIEQTRETVFSLANLTFEGFKVLAESQKLTDQKLQELIGTVDNLSATVDRHIREGHNGTQN